jgi:hypothetical protein
MATTIDMIEAKSRIYSTLIPKNGVSGVLTIHIYQNMKLKISVNYHNVSFCYEVGR